ncbi:MAG TPA: hypothetical protein VEA99_12465, partial [Gemmatimonadaceae bacterium]|nr:hypothetical protein [Gemmatimonadaceae bacterium]
HELHTTTTLMDHIAGLQRLLGSLGVDWRDGRRVTVITDSSGEYNATTAKSNTPKSDSRYFREAGFATQAAPTNPHVIDRVRTLQGLIRNATGRRRFFVHPRCSETKRCLMNQVWTKWGKPDKSGGLDHFPDAAGYLAWWLFPLRPRNTARSL